MLSRITAEAVRWYHKAAKQGSVRAQYNLGVMYGVGDGVTQDYVKAHKWFNIFFALGGNDPLMFQQRVEKEMSAQQIAEARKEATKWLEAYKKRRP